MTTPIVRPLVKPTTNLTREELLIEIQNVDTAGSVVKNEITGTAMKTIMLYVDAYIQAKEREARIAGRLTEARKIRQHLKDTNGYIDDAYFKEEIEMLITLKERENL